MLGKQSKQIKNKFIMETWILAGQYIGTYRKMDKETL